MKLSTLNCSSAMGMIQKHEAILIQLKVPETDLLHLRLLLGLESRLRPHGRPRKSVPPGLVEEETNAR